MLKNAVGHDSANLRRSLAVAVTPSQPGGPARVPQTPAGSPARGGSSYSRSSTRPGGSRASAASSAAASFGGGDDQSRPQLPAVPLYTMRVPARTLQVPLQPPPTHRSCAW